MLLSYSAIVTTMQLDLTSTSSKGCEQTGNNKQDSLQAVCWRQEEEEQEEQALDPAPGK